MVNEAAAAVREALAAGKTRQQLVLLLPVNEKEADFMATEAVDYPCSLQKEFDACVVLATSVLQRALGDQGLKINAKRIDDGGVEGEPCAVLFPEDQSCVAVVFPTADRLKRIQAYAKQAGRPLLLVNPQWNSSGQVVSDFGIGPWKAAAEAFLAIFEPTFCLKERRIGNPGTINAATGMRFSSGGVVRVQCRFPGAYEVHAMAADGSSQLLGTSGTEPTYQELEAMIARGRKQKLEIFEVAQRVTYVYAEPLYPEDADAGVEAAGEREARAAEDAALGFLSDADIEGMDAATLRRRLAQLGQPTSGKISKLRERLREARAAAAS